MGGDSSGAGGGEMTYFHKEPPARAVVEKVGPAGDGPQTGRTALSQSSLDPNVKGRAAGKRKETL